MQLVSDTQYRQQVDADSLNEHAILDAVRSLRTKQRDRKLLIDSIKGDYESHPNRDRKAQRLAIELIDDKVALMQMINDCSVWVQGVKL